MQVPGYLYHVNVKKTRDGGLKYTKLFNVQRIFLVVD